MGERGITVRSLIYSPLIGFESLFNEKKNVNLLKLLITQR